MDNDSALSSGVHFVHFVSEVTQAGYGVFFHNGTGPNHPDVAVPDHTAFRNAAACDLCAAAAFKNLPYLGPAYNHVRVDASSDLRLIWRRASMEVIPDGLKRLMKPLTPGWLVLVRALGMLAAAQDVGCFG